MRRFLPTAERLKSSRIGKTFGYLLKDPHLFHLNKRSVPLAVFIGVFWAFTPIPWQMLPAAMTAWWARANLHIAVALVWISNPLTIPALLLFCYSVGAQMLGIEAFPPENTNIGSWLKNQLPIIWKPLVLGCLASGVFFGGVGYGLSRWWWISTVRANWKARRRARADRR